MRWALLLLLAACTSASTGWLKGQLHVHTGRSDDSQTPPAEVAAWYAAHGYDFIVLTDHQVAGGLSAAPLLVIPGAEITFNSPDCQPPSGDSCHLHINAIGVSDATVRPLELPPVREMTRLAVYTRGIEAALALGALAQINHPNFHYGADGPLIARLAGAGAVLLEVANLAIDSNNEGDASHPDTFALWDQALDSGVTLWGTATDDAHHYADAGRVRASGELAFVGDRGWVMVHAAREPAAIKAALAAGDFYASDGVILREVRREGHSLMVRAAEPVDIVCTTSLRAVVRRTHGTSLDCQAPHGGWVRATVTDGRGKHAWTQPVR